MKVPDAVIKVKDLDLVEFMDNVQVILNHGLYETRIFTAVPDWAANEGESAIYASGTARELYYMIGEVWTRITFNSLGSMVIFDADGDTGITPEFSADEDVLRFYSAGTYMFAMDTNGLAMPDGKKVIFDGIGGDTYWTYDSASSYLRAYVDGTLRMEM